MKYQKTNVINEIGIPKPTIILLNLGFKPFDEASMLAVIIGAIADSITATSIIFECCCKITTYSKYITAGVRINLYKSPIPKNLQCWLLRSNFNCNPTDSIANGVIIVPAF